MPKQKNNQNINKITCSGRIVKQYEKKNGDIIITVASKSNSRDIFPTFYIKKDKIPSFKIRSHCTVNAHIHSYEYMDKKDNKHRFYQAFFVDDIKINETLTEKYFGVKGRFFEAPSCSVALSGEVVSIIDDIEWLRLILKIDNSEYPADRIRLNMKKIDRQPKIAINDYIYTVCSMTTSFKDINGKKTFFEDLIISDVAVKKRREANDTN